mgnify:FL=1
MLKELRLAILETAQEIGADPVDLATVISYETGGTFDPWKKGPTTKWGTHRGLIQWGEPQRRQYGVYRGMPIRDQVRAAGRYLQDRGFKPGMGLLEMYSAINAGGIGPEYYSRSDASAGGAPGTVLDKVTKQMEGHRRKAQSLLGMVSGDVNRLTFSQGESTSFNALGDGEVRYSDVSYNQPLTEGELRSLERERAEDDPTLWEGVKAAYSENLTYLLTQERPDIVPDPNFRMDEKLFSELTKGIPEQYWDRFTASVSEGHARDIRARLERELDAADKLNRMGVTGLALRIGAGLTDPATLAATAGALALTGGLGVPAVMAARFGRAGLIAEGALTGAATNVAIEGMIHSQRETSDASNLLWAAGLGAVLGGTGGIFARNPAVADEARKLEDLGRSMMKEAEGLSMTGGSTAGAAQVATRDALRSDIDDIIRDGAAVAPRAFMGNVRYDLAARLKQSDNMMTRMLGNVLVEDAARNADGVTPIAASEVQSLLNRRAELKWRQAYETAWNDYVRRNKIGWADQAEARLLFSHEITRAVRSNDVMTEFDPSVVKAANAFRDMMNEWRKLANNPGLIDGTVRNPVRGFGSLHENPNYVPRVFNLGAIQDKLHRFGHQPVIKFFTQAILEANEGISEELAEKFARGYVRKLHGLSAGELFSNYRAFSGEDLEALRMALREGTDLADDELDRILDAFRPKKGDGAVTRGKHRMLFDENFGMKLALKDGTGQEFVRISDFLENDADFLMSMYSRQMSGHIAMARVRVKNPNWRGPDDPAPEFLIDGVTNDGDFEKLLSQVIAVGDATGVKSSQSMKDVERLRFAYNAIIGRPTWNEASDFSQALRMLRDYNFLRVGGQMGFAQIPEFANIAAQVGIKAMLSAIPSFRSLWRNARTGKLDDALANEIDEITTLGTDWIRHANKMRMDEFQNPMQGLMGNRTIQSIDNKLQTGKRIVSAISGLAPVNTILQRMAGKAIFINFAKAAQGKAKLLKNDRRVQALGLDQEMVERIFKQINTHATFKKKSFGTRLEAMNFKKWDDLEAAAAFEMAVFRLGRTIVQENDIGNLAVFMSHPVARTLLQFRSFILAAWAKQFINGLNFRDFTTFTAFTTSVFLASLNYIARTHLNATGRSDRDEILEKRLTPERIALAGLQNSSWFSILAPATDLATISFLEEPLFDARTTMLASDPLWGNPTMDLIDSFSKATGAISTGAFTGEFSQADARDVARTLPFQNLIGITQLFSIMVSDLPEWRRRD